MIPYPDAGFLLSLLVHTDESHHASGILRNEAGPLQLNFLHQLQVANFLVALQKSKNSGRQAAGNEGQRTWRHHLDEGIFALVPTDWDSAFRIAITWNNQRAESPPPPLLLFHPALASVAGAAQFLSFDPRSRAVARAAGMRLLPA